MMDARAILFDMVYIWSQVNYEHPMSEKIRGQVIPTSNQAIGTAVLYWTQPNIPERKAWVERYSKPHAGAGFVFENWQVRAALMSESQMLKLAKHAGVTL